MVNRITKQCDRLTGLPYYEEFLAIAGEILKNEPEEGSEYVVVSTDISNFKFINQIYGYEIGNELIKDMVTTLVKENDRCLVACRPYSDHIVGLYSKTLDDEEYRKKLKRLTDKFIENNHKQFQSVLLHLHSGVCVIKDRSEGIVPSVDRANIARRSMKGDYTVPYVFFNEEMYKGKEKTSEVISIFDMALNRGNILVYLQPKVNVSNGKLEGAEALSRILCDDGRIMAPGEYVTILENSGRILELDMFMMEAAFFIVKNLLKKGIEPVPISVNLSRIHFYNDRMVQDIIDIFDDYEIPAKYIEFEVTESAFFSESGLISDKLMRLKEYGFKISMDDFGTGYSTLHSLAVLPIDVVKFDRDFIQNSMASSKGLKILSGLISLCKQIDFDVICEGVEDKVEEKIIYDCGCEHVQGYVYDKPLPYEDFLNKYIYSCA